MRTPTDDELVVGRVLLEDAAFMVIEVVKDNDRPLTLGADDRFLSLVFVHQPDDADLEPWLPWGTD